MKRMTWPQICKTQQFKGLWIALDNCRYDEDTLKPTEGDVVDSDEELSALCGRMREGGRGSCAILFCDGEVLVQNGPAAQPLAPAGSRVLTH